MEAWKLFEIMDEDDSGEISADEFVWLALSLGGLLRFCCEVLIAHMSNEKILA